ncbi:type I-E CRISPR-associated protein Cse2/CasB [Couchioplanes azureus]|uniref:type I-E CRISPR-associated protein Cse2/CasB n=1 Tax=Couchioplanes caeruleus TaxID=56438 RepID=UPI00166FF3E6|nr:type I-E CRISPR-associated protein Cse2/CasB [Couchioplanes caeruleus]GGQ50458.1 type I-E CRISPR-associated protein Cse2/CasB [Couchioplanes caeruleus subsp. azureus]
MTVPSPTPPRVRRRRPFGQHTAQTVFALQNRTLGRRDPAVVALMSELRGAVTRPPGSASAVLDVTGVPDRFFRHPPGDAPVDEEWAKHTALTLYAVHQQSLSAPMHADGISLGAAVSRLAHEADSGAAVRRRFVALGNATTYDVLTHDLRELIGLLRQRRIPLDYGLLADDLLDFRHPDGRDSVRALWMRDFYGITRSTGKAS